MTTPPRRPPIGPACALTTAVHVDGRPDGPRTAAHAVRVLQSGASYVTVFGTTGEGASFDAAEREAILGAMSDAGVAGGRMIVGLSSPSAREAAAQWRRAREAGAAYVLVPPPYYFKDVGEDGLFAWFAEIVEAAGEAACPMIAYTIPSVTAIPLSVGFVDRLKQAFPEVMVAVKDSTGDIANSRALLNAHPDLQILVGSEPDLAALVREGAAGSISGCANIVPQAIARICETGEEDPRIAPLVRAVLAHPVTPAVKALVAHVTGEPEWLEARAPLRRLSTGDASALGRLFDGLFAAEAA